MTVDQAARLARLLRINRPRRMTRTPSGPPSYTGRPACRSRRFVVGVGAELPVPFQPMPAERHSAALAGPQQLDLGHGADDVALHAQLVVQLGPRLDRLRAE